MTDGITEDPIVHPYTGKQIPVATPELLHALYQFLRDPLRISLGEFSHTASALPIVVAFGKGLDANYRNDDLPFNIEAYRPPPAGNRIADYYALHFEQLPGSTGNFAPHLAEPVEAWEKLANTVLGQARAGDTGLLFLPPVGGPSVLTSKRFPSLDELRYQAFMPFLHAGAPNTGWQHSSRGIFWMGHWQTAGLVGGAATLVDVRSVARELCDYRPWLMEEALPALVVESHPGVGPEPSTEDPSISAFELELTEFAWGEDVLEAEEGDVVLQTSTGLQTAPARFNFAAAQFAFDLAGGGTVFSFTVRKRSTVIGYRLRIFVEGALFDGTREFEISEQFGAVEPAIPGWILPWSGEAGRDPERTVTQNLSFLMGLPASDPLFLDDQTIPQPLAGFIRAIELRLVVLPVAARPSVDPFGPPGPDAPGKFLWRPQISWGIRAHWFRPLAAGGIKLFMINSSPFERTVRIFFDPDSPPITGLREEVAGELLDPEAVPINASVQTGSDAIVMEPYQVRIFTVESPLVFGRLISYLWESATDFKPGRGPRWDRHFELAIPNGQNMFCPTLGESVGADSAGLLTTFANALEAADPRLAFLFEPPKQTLRKIAWFAYFDSATQTVRPKAEPDFDEVPPAVWDELNAATDAVRKRKSWAGTVLFDEPNTYHGQFLGVHGQRMLFGAGVCLADPTREDGPPLTARGDCNFGLPGTTELLGGRTTDGYHPGVFFATPEVLAEVGRRIDELAGVVKPKVIHFALSWQQPDGDSIARSQRPAMLDPFVAKTRIPPGPNVPGSTGNPAGPFTVCGELMATLPESVAMPGFPEEVATAILGADADDFAVVADAFFVNSYPLKLCTPEYPLPSGYSPTDPPVDADCCDMARVSDPGWAFHWHSVIARELNSLDLGGKPVVLHGQAWGDSEGIFRLFPGEAPPQVDPDDPPPPVFPKLNAPQPGAFGQQESSRVGSKPCFELRHPSAHEARFLAWSSMLLAGGDSGNGFALAQGVSWFSRFFCPWHRQATIYAPLSREIVKHQKLLNGVDITFDGSVPRLKFDPPASSMDNFSPARSNLPVPRAHLLGVQTLHSAPTSHWVFAINPWFTDRTLHINLTTLNIDSQWRVITHHLGEQTEVSRSAVFSVALEPLAVLILELIPSGN